MKLKDSKTYLNLARSYAGECQARTRYEFIEYGARMQGYKQLAELVDKVVFNEFNHARMFYTFIQQSEEKHDEAERIYPEFAATAREEGFPEIAALYDNIIQVETCHQKLFSELYRQMKNGTIYKKSPNSTAR